MHGMGRESMVYSVNVPMYNLIHTTVTDVHTAVHTVVLRALG